MDPPPTPATHPASTLLLRSERWSPTTTLLAATTGMKGAGGPALMRLKRQLFPRRRGPAPRRCGRSFPLRSPSGVTNANQSGSALRRWFHSTEQRVNGVVKKYLDTKVFCNHRGRFSIRFMVASALQNRQEGSVFLWTGFTATLVAKVYLRPPPSSFPF